MLILDTEMENTGEFPTVAQLLRNWAAWLCAWLRRRPQPESERERSSKGQDCGTSLIL